MVRTGVPTSTSVGNQPASAGIRSLYCNKWRTLLRLGKSWFWCVFRATPILSLFCHPSFQLLVDSSAICVLVLRRCSGAVRHILHAKRRSIGLHVSACILVIWWDLTSGRAELETDTRHVAMVLRDLGLEKSTPVLTLVPEGPKSEEVLPLPAAKPLNAEDTTLYRSVTMRVNCLSLDRPDLSFAAGSVA